MAVRRMKSYTGQTGYVYQYYFVGKRVALESRREGSAEYIFDVTSDRKITFAVSVFIAAEATRNWGTRHGRSLTDTETYAAAKMRLFQAFDEIQDMQGQGRQLEVDANNVENLLEPLGLE